MSLSVALPHPARPGPRPEPARRTPRHARTVAACLAACLAALALAAPAAAHEWYPAYCCSGQDCYEISQEDVVFTGEGYFIKDTGEYYPRTAVPESPDGRFHRCSVGGRKEGRTLCLFAPAPAF